MFPRTLQISGGHGQNPENQKDGNQSEGETEMSEMNENEEVADVSK